MRKVLHGMTFAQTAFFRRRQFAPASRKRPVAAQEDSALHERAWGL